MLVEDPKADELGKFVSFFVSNLSYLYIFFTFFFPSSDSLFSQLLFSSPLLSFFFILLQYVERTVLIDPNTIVMSGKMLVFAR